MKFLGYARVSSGEQEEHGKSLAAQDYAIRYHAVGRSWHVLDVAHERGSGKDLGREKLQHTLQRLVDGEANGLIVTRLDRLTRSLEDFIRLVEWFKDAEKILVVLDFDLDTSTPAGELIAHMMAALAQWQRRVIAENTKNALAEKRRNGEPINQGSVQDRPEVAAQIRNLHGLGFTYEQICTALNTSGVPTARGAVLWRPSAIGSVLGKSRRAKRRASASLPSIR